MTDEHPVWDVYDLQRTARLNVKYYSHRLSQIERQNFIFEVVLAFAAPSSAIAGLFFWDTVVGKNVWPYLGVLAAILAVMKPILKFTEKIKRFEETLSGYKTLDHDLVVISTQIKHKKEYTPGFRKEFEKALVRKGILSKTEAELKEKVKLKEYLQEEVCKELPSDRFYIPTGA